MEIWFGSDAGVYLRDPELREILASSAAHRVAPTGAALPPCLSGPVAILFRQVATPSLEVIWFTRRARRLGFEPLVLEHGADRFCAHNGYKRALVTMPIILGRNRHRHIVLRKQKLIEHTRAEGQPLNALETGSGENLVAYHHRKLGEVMGTSAPRHIEIGSVLGRTAGSAMEYYVEFFRLLSGGLVLFEDFIADCRTAEFFDRVVHPAFRKVSHETGQRPQIARLTQGRRVLSPLWNAYPCAAADEPGWALDAGPRGAIFS
ncbi:hypothetical protein [Rubellimicrobium arenae]|uniref:hypothetical protein n=1 Tax=Rubellimicrobium arenae TaxID=2817372 RepID=UPI001B317E49|nr:hypothetical protein [Rubellimicrobium arenae]